MPNSSLHDLLALVRAATEPLEKGEIKAQITLTFDAAKLAKVDLERATIQEFLDETGAKATLTATSTAPHGGIQGPAGDNTQAGEDDSDGAKQNDPA